MACVRPHHPGPIALSQAVAHGAIFAPVRPIDVRHMGRERVICCWEVDGVLVDPGPQSCEATLLEALGGEAPRAIVLTHIHLDHAGGVGSLSRRFPGIPVYVHERGAPHVVDPSRLVSSASRLYPDMDERWGEVLPVPEQDVHVIGDGDTVLGMFRVLYTPGHASHHVSFLHEASGTAFVGDMVGVRIAPEGYSLMPTPPPDIDVERWLASLDAIEAWDATSFALTHWGGHEDVGELLSTAREQLAAWPPRARAAADADAFTAEVEADLDARIADAGLRAAYRQASPPPLQYPGLDRYWTKLGAERHPA
jgi:glyoxylase-like metal-dependent hydrolase (beta-lactamase superfamily II)